MEHGRSTATARPGRAYGVRQKGLTGAACARGIGRAAADRMASEGWSIQGGSKHQCGNKTQPGYKENRPGWAFTPGCQSRPKLQSKPKEPVNYA